MLPYTVSKNFSHFIFAGLYILMIHRPTTFVTSFPLNL